MHIIRLVACAVAAFAGMSFATYAGEPCRYLPSGYTQVEWIESQNGGCWINTGVKSSKTISAWMDFVPYEYTGGVTLGQTVNDNADWRYFCYAGGGVFDFGSGRLGLNNSACKLTLNSRYVIECGWGRFSVKSGDAVLASLTGDNASTPTDNYIGVFGGPSGMGGGATTTKMRLYALKLWDGEALVADLVPAIRDEDGAIGLYDMVEGHGFREKSGDGAFTAGVEIVSFINASASLTRQGDDFVVSTEVLFGGGDLYVDLTDAEGSVTTETVALQATVGDSFDKVLDLQANASYVVTFRAVNGDKTIRNTLGTVFSGSLGVTATANADEETGDAGTFLVSLANGAVAADDLTVNCMIGGTAVPGRHYVALAETVTIPKGEGSATVSVVPIFNREDTEDVDVVLSLADGFYQIDAQAATATVSIKDADFSSWNFADNKLSGGGWVFEATADGTDLTVGTVLSGGSYAGATLDFSKPVEGGYTIVTLNPKFSAYADRGNLAELLLPSAGLKEISQDAFSGCTALTRISPYLPDSVTTLGKAAFKQVPAAQDLRLCSVAKVQTSSFYQSGVTAVYFGPALKSIDGGWGSGAFASCASLTNVTFDADITGAEFVGTERHFDSCTKLVGTVDLSGFKSVLIGTNGTGNPFVGCTGISEFIFGAELEKFGCGSMNGLTGLRKITFKGKPPKFYTTRTTEGTGNLFGGIGNAVGIETYIPEEYKDEWSAYAKDGIINSTTSCWATPWTVAEAQTFRPLIYKKAGGGGELGVWVYDSTSSTLTRDDWKFNARKLGGGVIVETCISAPAAVSVLDFTGSVTDEDGNPLAIVSLDTKFSTTTDFRAKIGELVFNDELSAVGENAFNGCTTLTNIVNFIPDNVVTLGKSAFQGCDKLNQSLALRGLKTIPGSAFQSTTITNATFGAKLASIEGSAFNSCTKLRTLTFDPEMSGCSFGSGESHFYGCSVLGQDGPLDLRGFSSVYVEWGGEKSPFRQCPKIGEVWLGEGLTKLSGAAFNDMSGITNVVFYGAPPATFTGSASRPFLSNFSRVITTHIFRKYRSEWAAYVLYDGAEVDKVPPGRGVTWKPAYISGSVSPSLRPVRIIDMSGGVKMIFR